MSENTYSLIVQRDSKTDSLTIDVAAGDAPRSEFTRVLNGLTEEEAIKRRDNLLADFQSHGKLWNMYENGERALPTADERANIIRNHEGDEKYTEKLTNYINRQGKTPPFITVLETPYVLKMVGVKAQDVTIAPSVINKCMATEETDKIKHPHGLSFDVMSKLAEELRNPVMIMNSATQPNSLVAVTSLKDNDKNNIIVSLANDTRNGLEICAISSSYGKDKIQNFIKNNLDKIIAYNKEKTNEVLGSEHLLRTEQVRRGGGKPESIISFDNSIAYSLKSVNGFLKENIEKISEPQKKQADERGGNIEYKYIPQKTYVKTDLGTAAKLAERLNAEGIKHSYILRGEKNEGTVTVGAADIALAETYAKQINPAFMPKNVKEKLSFDEILNHFSNVKAVSPTQHAANCPCCSDTKQHLYIKLDETNGNVLLDCKKGCSTADITAAAGLKMPNLFTEQTARPEAASRSSGKSAEAPPNREASKPEPEKQESPIFHWRNYNYTDEKGAALYQKSVAVRENGDKFATWKHRDDNGDWVKGLNGGKPPLYQQTNLINNDKVYIVEGEKDVRTMEKLGLPAVCSPHGSNWDARFTPLFEGKDVVVVTDNDTPEAHPKSKIPPGVKYGEDIFESLQGIAKSVKIIPAEEISLTPLKEGGDISDIAENVAPDALKRLIELAEQQLDPSRLPDEPTAPAVPEQIPGEEVSAPARTDDNIEKENLSVKPTDINQNHKGENSMDISKENAKSIEELKTQFSQINLEITPEIIEKAKIKAEYKENFEEFSKTNGIEEALTEYQGYLEHYGPSEAYMKIMDGMSDEAEYMTDKKELAFWEIRCSLYDTFDKEAQKAYQKIRERLTNLREEKEAVKSSAPPPQPRKRIDFSKIDRVREPSPGDAKEAPDKPERNTRTDKNDRDEL